MLRKAAGTDYIPKQAEALQKWIDAKELEEVRQKDDFEVWMDTLGQAFVALVIVFGILLLIINIPRLLGWW